MHFVLASARSWSIAILAFLVGSSPVTSLRADSSTLELARREYPGAVARLKSAYSRLRAGGRIELMPPSTGEAADEFDVYVSGPMRKAVIREFRSSPSGLIPSTESVLCIGRDTAFRANRGLTRGGSYILKDVAPIKLDQGAPPNAVADSFREIAGKFIFAPFLINGWDDGTPTIDPGSISDATQIQVGADRVIRMSYEKKPITPGASPISGVLDVLPDRAWVARRHEVKGGAKHAGGGAPSPYRILLEVEYGDPHRDVPVPRLVRYVGKRNLEMTFDRFDLDSPTPDREFTTDFLNLPDPAAPPADPARNSTIYWLLGLALATFLLSIFLKRRYK